MPFAVESEGGPFAGAWLLPGGQAAEDESAVHALVREVREETGLTMTDAVYVAGYRTSGEGYELTVLMYRGPATGSLVQSADHPNGHFSATLSTTWSSAQSKSFTDNDGDDDDGTVTVSCAPSTASITLSNGTSSTASYTGKTCSWTRNGTTKYAFFGAASNGTRAFLKEEGSTVSGAVFSGDEGLHMGVFAAGHMGSCDHNH